MDMFLGKVTQHAMNYAIRSGIGLTASFAIRQTAKLLSTAPKSSVRDELYQLQKRLQHKIHIISPAIDMIELIAARGHTSLESAVSLTKELRLDIQSLGQRLAAAASASADAYRTRKHNSSQVQAQNEIELKLIVSDIKRLIERIEDAVPLINLAITTSGASLSTTLPHTVSPSRLLQASTFLTAGDTQYSITPQRAIQIGPTFTLTIYMLFAGHDRPQNEEDIRETTWKEVMHKARVKLRRVPLDMVLKTGSGSDAIPAAQISSAGWNNTEESSTSVPAEARVDEYAYQMMIIEDYDDDRYHDFENDARPEPFDDVQQAGIREMLPIHEISKIFYADTSKVLNIGSDAESNHPVLLLKRDLNAIPPRRMLKDDAVHEDTDEESVEQENLKDLPDKSQPITDLAHGPLDPWRLPPSLDPEWIAFEVYTEPEPSDSEDEDNDQLTSSTTPTTNIDTDQSPSNLASSLSHLRVHTPLTASPSPAPSDPFNKIKTSLSLLELLLRLTSLQQFQQQSHLSITDELLNFFLEESASTGAGGDEAYRQHLRAEARRRVGWDPYDESPMKRRGEDYQYQNQYQASSPYEGGPGSGRGFFPSPDLESTRGVTPSSPVEGNGRMNSTGSGRWSPRDINPQTRSKMQFRDVRSPSPNPIPSPILTSTHRPSSGARTRSWARREGDDMKRGSPLRPNTAVTDEGIGTSPASGDGIGDGNGKNR
ncbi:hypothetical protein PV10_07525 [Exophiala mesophila]|uniref:Ran-binding-domain-containing protein n=1 Tax=Exophiala mesophila TaxID=212818 RepID=A0A0D1Z845_EXOME|nr:uncharacterized protein PV10_07525 [Exophiala mesophila]KIV90194.1 hypothetical protein PV10_07525 [Exophiala mesophila]